MNSLSPTEIIYAKKAELLNLTNQVVDPTVKERIKEQLKKIEIGTFVFVTELNEEELEFEKDEIILARQSLTAIETELQRNPINNTLARTFCITTVALENLTAMLAKTCGINPNLVRLYS